jgi:Leucine-rich repeat (LRR) protein
MCSCLQFSRPLFQPHPLRLASQRPFTLLSLRLPEPHTSLPHSKQAEQDRGRQASRVVNLPRVWRKSDPGALDGPPSLLSNLFSSRVSTDSNRRGRAQSIENLPVSSNLRSLFLGKNKITKIEGLEGLTGLRTLSIQSALSSPPFRSSAPKMQALIFLHNGFAQAIVLPASKDSTRLSTSRSSTSHTTV